MASHNQTVIIGIKESNNDLKRRGLNNGCSEDEFHIVSSCKHRQYTQACQLVDTEAVQEADHQVLSKWRYQTSRER